MGTTYGGDIPSDYRLIDEYYALETWNRKRIGVAVVNDVDGEFIRRDEPFLEPRDCSRWDCTITTNPSVAILPSGKTYMIYKSRRAFGKPLQLGVAVADKPDGKFERLTENPILEFADENKQISFRYFDYNAKHEKVYRKNGERYVSNPLAMVWDKDNYYLLSFNNGHSEPVTYRLDKIDSVEIESNDREKHSEYSDFDSEEYKKIAFSMYGGETKNVTLTFDEEMITSIFDKFGEKVEIKENSGTYEAAVTIQSSKPFFLWVTGTLGKVKITESEEVVKRFNDFVNAIKENY